MSSRKTTSSGPRRNLSKVQQQLAAEEQARDKAIKDRRRREYLERKARRDRKARAKSTSGASSSPSKPTQSVTHNGVTVEGNTFTLPGLRSSGKKQQGLTLGDALSAKSKTVIESSLRSSKQTSDFKVTKGAFAAFDDSDDEDAPQQVVITTSDATRAHHKASASAWSNFRAGNFQPKPKPIQAKAVVRVLTNVTKPATPAQASPVESEHSSDEEEPADAWSTDGDYESDGAFGESDFEYDFPEFDDEGC